MRTADTGLIAFICLNYFIAHTAWQADLWITLTNKNNLSPLRLLNVLLVLIIVWASVVGRAERGDPPLRSRWLETLGRHSLLVFSVHVVGALVILGLPSWFEWSPAGAGRWFAAPLLIILMTATAFAAERLAARHRTPQSDRA